VKVEGERETVPAEKRRRWRWVALAILILLLLLLLHRCFRDRPSVGANEAVYGPTKTAEVRPSFNPWKPTTVPHRDICAGEECRPVGGQQTTASDGTGSHRHGTPLPLAINPKVDDPVAQWGDCIASVLACIDGGSDASGCVVAGQCPVPCQQRVASALGGASSEEAALAAFEKVYMQSGADCRPGSP
jgi:hypothetical protein